MPALNRHRLELNGKKSQISIEISWGGTVEANNIKQSHISDGFHSFFQGLCLISYHTLHIPGPPVEFEPVFPVARKSHKSLFSDQYNSAEYSLHLLVFYNTVVKRRGNSYKMHTA